VALHNLLILAVRLFGVWHERFVLTLL